MRCPNCGADVSKRAERCPECDVPLTVTCPGCGDRVQVTDTEECPTCGASLTHAGQAA